MVENGIIVRRLDENDKQTIGEITVWVDSKQVFACKSLELPWLKNERKVSRIFAGEYPAAKEKHAKFGNVLRLSSVKSRDGILVHVGNYYYQLRGCILPGMSFKDLDNDGHVDVVSSRKAMDKIYELLPDDQKLVVRILDIQ